MALVERLLKSQGEAEADIRNLKEYVASLKGRIETLEEEMKELHDLREQAKGGWNSLTKGASIVAAIIGGAVAIISWFKGGR